MPIYEYECPVCGVIEVFQGITEEPLTRCPECKRRKVKKLISESCFHLKGSGWYATDYARGNGGNGGNGKSADKDKHSESKDSASTSSASTTSSSKDSSKSDSSSKGSDASSAASN